MEEANVSTLHGLSFKRRVLSLVLVCLSTGLVVAGVARVWKWWSPNQRSAPEPSSKTVRSVPDPRLTWGSPYKNVHPDVKYVGDAVCGRCHEAIAKNYRRHPMGRSLSPVSAAQERLQRAGPRGQSFEADGFEYSIECRGEKVFHQEARRNAKGQVISRIEAEVHFVVGSGSRGRSYLLQRDGHLLQSPISWYAQKQIWGLSPGYEERNTHFERDIGAKCLFCHAHQVRPVEDSLSRYELPIFRGHAIGCERCHGPGDLHVKGHEGGDDAADTIVNPRRLEPSLRDAVCEQCHLQGEIILRAGRETFDYRPGLPLHLFKSIFIRRPEYTDDHRSVSQVEQMRVSRCFQKSGGGMACISCHDPHRVPEQDARTSYYRNRCLTCHTEHSCSLPPTIRREKSKEDSCIQCHMPRFGSSNIAHTAVTDHRILRQPSDKERELAGPQPAPDEIPIVHFHRHLVKADDPDVARDLAIALTMLARARPTSAYAAELGRLALPRLESAVETWPGDVPAWEAKAYAYWLQGREGDARKAHQAALERSPEREITLIDAAQLATAMGDLDDAVAYWQRLIRVNPWRSDYHVWLADTQARNADWSSAALSLREALRLNPAHLRARWLLVRVLLRLGDRRQAQAEFDLLMEFDPPDKEALEQWFKAR